MQGRFASSRNASPHETRAPIADVAIVPRKDSMQIYMFTSEAGSNLRAFAGDPAGSKLPENHGPWAQIGSLRSDQHPSHLFSRAKIEQAIKFVGFQLWRMKKGASVEPA